VRWHLASICVILRRGGCNFEMEPASMSRSIRQGSASVEAVMNFAIAVPAAFGMLFLMNYLLKGLYHLFCFLIDWPLL
jgi:hypothetical protein